MMLKSAMFATVLVGMAAAGASGATAGSRHSGWNNSYNYNHSYNRSYQRPYYTTTTQCIRGHRVVLRVNQWGRVVSRTVVGRCFGPRFWTRMNRY